METELSFSGLYRGFGRLRVLRDVSGAVGGGQLLLITGRNGSGKSTLLRCLAGLMRPQRGEIRCLVDGRELDFTPGDNIIHVRRNQLDHDSSPEGQTLSSGSLRVDAEHV